MPASKKRKLDTSQLSDSQQSLAKSIAATGLAPEERVHEAVLITGDNEDEAVQCLLDEAYFDTKKTEFLNVLNELAELQASNNRDGLRSKGGHAAANRLATMHTSIPTELAGNTGQGAASGMSLVRLAMGDERQVQAVRR